MILHNKFLIVFEALALAGFFFSCSKPNAIRAVNRVSDQATRLQVFKMEDISTAASTARLVSQGEPFVISSAGVLDTVPALRLSTRARAQNDAEKIFQSEDCGTMAIFNDSRVYFTFKNRLTEEINIFVNEKKAAAFYKHNVLPRAQQTSQELANIKGINVQKDLFPSMRFGNINRRVNMSKLSADDKNKLLELNGKAAASSLNSAGAAVSTDQASTTIAQNYLTYPPYFYLKYYLDDPNNDVWGFFAQQVQLYQNYTYSTFILSYSTLSDADKKTIFSVPSGVSIDASSCYGTFNQYISNMGMSDFWTNFFLKTGCVFAFLSSNSNIKAGDEFGMGGHGPIDLGNSIDPNFFRADLRTIVLANNGPKTTSSHEMGHALGLQHNWAQTLVALVPPFFIPIYYTDIMYPYNGSLWYVQNQLWQKSDVDKVVAAFQSYVDRTPPNAPTGLAASNITSNTLVLNWKASTDNIGVTAYDVYRVGAPGYTVTTNSAKVTGLSCGNVYSFFVIARDAFGNGSYPSNTFSVPVYWVSGTLSTKNEYIANVQFHDVVQSSGPASYIENSSSARALGYSDFTNIYANASKGHSYKLTVTTSWPIAPRAEYYSAWIDYNHNALFDEDERVSSVGGILTPFVAKFTIPSTALKGPTRMRITMTSGTIPGSIGYFQTGEVEDYTVIIQ